MRRLGFDVFGKHVQLRQSADGWEARYVGVEGKQRPAPDIRVPPDTVPHEVAGSLADLCHEWATPNHSQVALTRSATKLSPGAGGPRTLVMRPAGPDDIPILRYWDEQPHIIESDPNDDWQCETELFKRPDWREQLIAEVEGKPIGFVEIIDPAREEEHYWGDVEPNLRAVDIWIGEAGFLRRGLGTHMMKDALMRCFAPPDVAAVLIDPLDSNARALHFYRQLGFAWLEARRFGEDDCAVHQMTRARYLDLHVGMELLPAPHDRQIGS